MADAKPLFKEPIYKTSLFWIRAISLFFILLFLINFKDNIISLLTGIWMAMWGAPQEAIFSPSFVDSLWMMGYNLLSFASMFMLIAIMVSAQALLPTQSFYEVWNTLFHLILHILGLHGLAIFVKDGKALATPDDWKRISLGVVVIDFNSAVVLEEQVPPPTLFAGFYKLLELFLRALWLYPRRQTPRACHTGITFTRKRERIRGVVDLRKQSRARLDVGAYTRDGIEMKSLIFTIFTLGMEPDVLPVSYRGGRRSANMCVVNWRRLPNRMIRVEGLADELDEDDRIEIQQYAQRAGANGELCTMAGLSNDFLREWFRETPPQLMPSFNPQRVFNAVFTQARAGENMLSWDEMPANVSINLFREILLRHNYDDIFSPTDPSFPLRMLRNELRIKARNNGVLSYALVLHRSGRPLTPGDYDPADILVSPVYPLTSPKPLRDRGIKMLVAGFNDLLPVSDLIYKQRLENWRVNWASETIQSRASHELEASRIFNEARRHGVENMIYQLQQIFDSGANEEALAYAIMQALESASSDPRTRQLLPNDTISMMRNINSFLKPGGSGGGSGSVNLTDQIY